MRYQINLLQEKEKDMSGKILYFVLHYLRYILVITQIVVIAVFFYRFKIDQEVIDLRDELLQKEEIVEVSNPLLKEAQAVDMKTREIRDIIVKQESFNQMFSYFLSVFPAEMKVEHLDISEKGLKFEAITSQPQVIKEFLDKLKADKAFKTIDLGSIRRDDDAFHCPFQLIDFIPK
ncbi:MAG: hypothetical protein WC489_02820 [Patescibacteria group bacterium]